MNSQATESTSGPVASGVACEHSSGTQHAPTQSLKTTASWVIRERDSGRVVCETFSPALASNLKPAFEAIPILDYLQALARAAKSASLA